MSGTSNNKHVIISGASRGVGALVARKLAEQGAVVYAGARSLGDLKRLAEDFPDNIVPLPLDVRDPVQVESFMTQVRERTQSIDVLINNAGVGIFKHLEELTPAEWDLMIATNLTGPFLLARAVIPMMKEQREGLILQMNSVAGLEPFRNAAGYCASKYGLHGLTQVMREELRKFNIKVVELHPGAIASTWWDQVPGSENLPRDKMLSPETVVDIILQVISTPVEAVVEEMVIRYVGGNF